MQEREREAKSATGSNNWCEFMTILGRLAILEATYFSLSYLERSRADTWRLSRREVRKAAQPVGVRACDSTEGN